MAPQNNSSPESDYSQQSSSQEEPLLAWGIYTIVVGFLTPYVDNFAHLGGAIGGGVAMLFQKPTLLEWKELKYYHHCNQDILRETGLTTIILTS